MTDLASVILSTRADRRAQQEHDVRMQRDANPENIAKEVQLKGLKLDYDNTEQTFLNGMQEFEQQTRTLLAKKRQTEAEMGVEGATAAQERQPDELALAREQLTANVGAAAQRQLATLWGTLKIGNTRLALDMLNKSKLLAAGEDKFTGFKIEDQDATGPDGKPQKIKMLVMQHGDGDQHASRIPINQLEQLHQQFGAQYKVVEGNIVRIGPDGKPTPIYTAPKTKVNPETGTYYDENQPPAARGIPRPAPSAAPGRAPVAITGTGLPAPGTVQLPGGQPPAESPPAAMGVQPDNAQTPDQPPLTRRQEKHIDTRVTQGTAVVNKYFGISEFSGLDPKNQPKYITIVNRMGQLVRGGTSPEAAAQTAIAEAERAEKLRNPGAGSTAPYSGPTPWRQ